MHITESDGPDSVGLRRLCWGHCTAFYDSKSIVLQTNNKAARPGKQARKLGYWSGHKFTEGPSMSYELGRGDVKVERCVLWRELGLEGTERVQNY
jgi:hypothetical protein